MPGDWASFWAFSGWLSRGRINLRTEEEELLNRHSVTVLGVNDGHDAGAALVRDGMVLSALQEERPTNLKHFTGTPENSIELVFQIAKVDPSEVDLIAVVSLNRVMGSSKDYPLKLKLFEKMSPLVHSHTFSKLYVKFLHKFRSLKHLEKTFEKLGIEDKESVFIDHHLCHASAAYRSSPYPYEEQVVVLSADGAGDGLSSTVSVGEKGEIKRIASSTYYDSLGNALYSEITRYLGMTPWDHEYKVMGLAPYGRPDFCIEHVRKIIRVHPERPLEFENTVGAYLRSIQPKLQRLLAGQRFDNIAAAVQRHFEELMTSWVKNIVKITGIGKLACAGGLFLNVKANKLLLEIPGIEEVFFYPAAGDDGTPVGAALQAYWEYCVRDGLQPVKVPLRDLYYGPSYGEEEVRHALKEADMAAEAARIDDIEGFVGEQVAKGRIIARFNGRLEWGPRALGNRSILADARDFKVVRKINSAIKQRDFWMPFAPTILDECLGEYLINPRPAPYMILAFDTTEKRNDLVAALHPSDYTCRPQTLNDTWNLGYRRVLETFQDVTGVGGLLNTSFNLHGYPIVCTPQQAIWTLKNSQLDGLALEHCYLEKSK